jgi:hypothetical protein
MEPIMTVAISAAVLLGTKAFEAIGTKAGETTWAGMGRLVTLIRAKTRGHQWAEATLADIERGPADPDRMRALSEILATLAAQDRRFRRELAALITEARQDPVVGPLATQIYDRAKVGQIFTVGQMRDFYYYAAPPAPGTPQALNPLMQISSRFMQVFEWHGVHPAEIPDFLELTGGPSVSLADLSSKERLLDRLVSQLLDFTTETFALHRDWLRQDGAAQVLTSRDFYKSVEGLADFLMVQSIRRGSRTNMWYSGSFHRAGGSMYFFSTEQPSVENHESQHIYVGAIYRVPIIDFRGRTVCRYYAVKALPWDYWRSHFALVAMMTIADACGIGVLGRYLPSQQDVIDLCEGRRFPVELIEDWIPSHETWSPEYPYFGEQAGAEQEDYLRKWSRYYTDFEGHTYEGAILDAKEERRRA